jgi:hypothetical protein
VLPGRDGPPPVVVGVLASALHTGAGDLMSPAANRIWDLGFGSRGLTSTSSCHPWRRHRAPLCQPRRAPRLLSPPFTHHASAKESTGVDAGRRETTPRCVLAGLSQALRALLWESLEVTTVSTEAVFLNARPYGVSLGDSLIWCL